MKQSRYLWLHGGYVVVIYSQKLRSQKMWLLSQIWSWRPRSIVSQTNSYLNLGILHLWYKFGDPSLNRWWVITWTSSKLGKFWHWGEIWHWSQDQSPNKTIGVLTKVFYTYGPNLVILAWMGDKLSYGQPHDYRTQRRIDGHKDSQTQATTIPEGQNWHWVKKSIIKEIKK